LFSFQAPKTELSTYRADHSSATTVYNPSYVPVQDFAYATPEEETGKRQRLETVCDVNPLAVGNRRSHAFEGQSSYKSNFVNFFPGPTEVSGGVEVKTETFSTGVLGAVAQPEPVLLPFDIETRDPGSQVALSSEYREKFVDFANPPVQRENSRSRTIVQRPSCLRAVWDGAPTL
jgi:hypothetical protein